MSRATALQPRRHLGNVCHCSVALWCAGPHLVVLFLLYGLWRQSVGSLVHQQQLPASSWRGGGGGCVLDSDPGSRAPFKFSAPLGAPPPPPDPRNPPPSPSFKKLGQEFSSGPLADQKISLAPITLDQKFSSAPPTSQHHPARGGGGVWTPRLERRPARVCPSLAWSSVHLTTADGTCGPSSPLRPGHESHRGFFPDYQSTLLNANLRNVRDLWHPKVRVR